ncbi:hypothetical protein T02_3885 [Trichinella nativa]|uniref:Uncharacterized protein n=2 Tax=Trichinella TaxID=6333 RepID=A0A0V1LK05_9BILA|nr:hypothetical protein T05_16253 [Trichinella murrelli]KRZ59841.1 hypothetical protein T02_3885 [Trichinella nativa]KRZ91600.1 hypothetical protein T08_15157 [Trichinella sp. T8]
MSSLSLGEVLNGSVELFVPTFLAFNDDELKRQPSHHTFKCVQIAHLATLKVSCERIEDTDCLLAD